METPEDDDPPHQRSSRRTPKSPARQVNIEATFPPESVGAVVTTRTETTETMEEKASCLRIAEAEAKHERDEEEAEARHRRARELADARHQRTTFWAVFLVLIFVAIGATLVVFFSDDAENQTFGRAAATAVIGALVGFLGGSISNPIKKPRVPSGTFPTALPSGLR